MFLLISPNIYKLWNRMPFSLAVLHTPYLPTPIQVSNWYLILQIHYFKKVTHGPVKLENYSCRMNHGCTLYVLGFLYCSVNMQASIVHCTELAWYYRGTDFLHGNWGWELYGEGKNQIRHTKRLCICVFALCREILGIKSHSHLQII